MPRINGVAHLRIPAALESVALADYGLPTSMLLRNAAFTLVLGASVACSSGGGDLDYGDCPEGYLSECARFDVPLDHAGGSAERISIHIARHPAKDSATKQLWLLAGGPGGAGNAYGGLISVLHEELPDTDIYVMDHRGTGYSHRLFCKSLENDEVTVEATKSCLDELEQQGDKLRLAYFTVTQAAQDLVQAIEATRSPDQQVFLWGASYGTVWAHRAAQIAPAGLLSGVVFDGFLTPNGSPVLEYDHGVEEVGIRLAAACAKDVECRTHIGPDPLASVRALYTRLDTSPCQGIDGAKARIELGSLIDFQELATVFPAMVRLSRCAVSDQTELTFLHTRVNDLQKQQLARRALFSNVLYLNIGLSELWSAKGVVTPSAEELQKRADAQNFVTSDVSTAARLLAIRQVWPLPPVPPEFTKPVKDPSMAMLWLAGTMDTRTPLDQANKITRYYPKSSYVVIPAATHVPGSDLWGYRVVLEFLRTRKIDRNLIGISDAPVRWHDAQSVKYTWGTTEQWGAGNPSLP